MLSSVGGARMPHTLSKFCGRILHCPTAGTLQPARALATSRRATGRVCSAKAKGGAGSGKGLTLWGEGSWMLMEDIALVNGGYKSTSNV